MEPVADNRGLTQDFHRHAVAIAASGKPDPSRYDILWAPGGDQHSHDILTPAKWIELLSSDTIEKDVFFLSRRYPSSNVAYERETGYHTRENYYYDSVRKHERPRRAPLHRSYTGYRERETDDFLRSSRDRSVSGSVSNGSIGSRPDQESVSGQNDQGSSPNDSPENTRPGTKSAPKRSSRERPTSGSPRGSRSEGSDDQQSPGGDSPEIFDIAITPGNLVPVERNGRWVVIVPYDSQRLLTWPGDQVGTRNSSSVEVGGRWFFVGNSDAELHGGARQTRFQLETEPTHTDDDGIRIVPLTNCTDEDDERRDFPPPPPPPSRYFRETGGEDEYFYRRPRRTGGVDERRTSSRHHRNGRQEAPPKSSGLITFPFFTWRVKHGTGWRQPQLLSIQERDETVVRILAKIHESITSDKSSYRTLYAEAYRCAVDDLFLRHPDVAVKTKADDDPEDNDCANPVDELLASRSSEQRHNMNNRQSAGGTQTEAERKQPSGGGSPGGLRIDQRGPEAGKETKGKQAEGTANARGDQVELSGSENIATPIGPGEGPSNDTKPHANTKPRTPHPVEGANRGLVLKTKLLEVSQAIFRAFLPSQAASSYHDYYHPLCERFWGSLDEIFRVSRTYHLKLIMCY